METLLQERPMHMSLKVVIVYERIEQLARRTECRSASRRTDAIIPHELTLSFSFSSSHRLVLFPAELDVQFSIYSQTLDVIGASVPPLLDTWGLDESETLGKLNHVIIYGHIHHHGCVMLLYSLKAKTDMRARAKVIGAARTLAELGLFMRGKKGLKRLHASLLLMVSIFPSECCPTIY